MSTETGLKAERVAGLFLQRSGFKILKYNWRLPQCEIDIVALKNNTIYLVEVKYRKNSAYGNGFEYITPKKLASMQFAAANWRTYNNWKGGIQLSAVSVTGSNFDVDGFVENVT